MTKKASKPCAICARGMALHRGKRKVCSPSCDAELRLLLAKARPKRRRAQVVQKTPGDPAPTGTG